MILTSEFIFDNIKLNETSNIIQNIIEEYGEKYDFYLDRDV